MERALVLRGAVVGALGGLLAFVFARIFAESQISQAIDYENGRDAAQAALDKAAGLPAEAAGSDLFSRTVQADVGIGVGMILFGVAMGLLFAVTYALCLGRVGDIRPRNLALLVAGAGFLALYLVPFVKYPANPPAIGHEETIKARTGLYMLMVLASVVLAVLAVMLGQKLRSRFGLTNWTASILAAVAFLVAVGLVMLVLPAVGELSVNKHTYGNHSTETPQPLTDRQGHIVYPGFPADVLSKFRIYSVGAQLLLWTVIGLAFAPLAERVLSPAAARRTTPAAAEPAAM